MSGDLERLQCIVEIFNSMSSQNETMAAISWLAERFVFENRIEWKKK